MPAHFSRPQVNTIQPGGGYVIGCVEKGRARTDRNWDVGGHCHRYLLDGLVLRRASSATGGVFEHPSGDVVGDRHVNHGRLRRRLPHHTHGTNFDNLHHAGGNRIRGPSRGDHGQPAVEYLARKRNARERCAREMPERDN